MKELSKEELLEIIDADIKAGEKIISSQENSKVIKAIERRIQAYRQIRQLIKNKLSKEMPKNFSKRKDPLFIEGKPPSITLHYPPKGYHELNEKKSIDKKRKKK